MTNKIRYSFFNFFRKKLKLKLFLYFFTLHINNKYMFFDLPLELQIHIISFFPINIFCCLPLVCTYFNYLCDIIINFENTYPINEEYFTKRRDFFVKFLEKSNKFNNIMNTIYLYSLRFKNIPQRLPNSENINTSFTFYGPHNAYNGIDYAEQGIDSLISNEINLVDKNQSHRIEILELYKKQFKMDYYKAYTFKKYLRSYLQNFIVPKIDNYDFKNLDEIFDAIYLGCDVELREPKMTIDDICNKCEQFIKTGLFEEIDGIYIDLIQLRLIFRLHDRGWEFDGYWSLSYNTKLKIDIKSEFEKIIPSKKIKSVKKYHTFIDYYKIDDLGYLLVILGIAKIKYQERMI